MTLNKKKLTPVILVTIFLLMLGLSFAAVPLYELFCRVTGFAGTTQNATNKEVPKVASEALKYHGYIELGMFNNQYDAKVSLGEIIIKHYVALSGLTPYIEEVIVDGIQMMYVIKLGPFNNRERVDFICDKFIAASDSCIKI